MPPHFVLHMFKVYLDDFTGANVENIAWLLEGCGRFLLRTSDTTEQMTTMVPTSLKSNLITLQTYHALAGDNEEETSNTAL